MRMPRELPMRTILVFMGDGLSTPCGYGVITRGMVAVSRSHRGLFMKQRSDRGCGG